ncbi:hypothetical protein OAU50_00505 [Planctomycetota bacterium]|nr:hypothetical protein [Planctomycetota bacterium]
MRFIFTFVLFCFGSALLAQITPTNLPPTITVSTASGSVTVGSTVNVNFNDTVVALGIGINTTDPDSTKVGTTTTINNLGSTGIVLSEWAQTGTPPFNIAPTSGTFNTVAGATHSVQVTASDGVNTTNFSFNIVQAAQGSTGPTNTAPTVGLTHNGAPVVTGATVNVAYNSTVSAEKFVLTINDADNNNTSTSTTIGNIGATGMLTAEWSSSSAAVSYTLTPNSGTFNTTSAVIYTVVVTADDGTDQTVFTFYISQAAQGSGPGPGPGPGLGGGGGGGGCVAATSSTSIWAALLLLGVASVLYRRRKTA